MRIGISVARHAIHTSSENVSRPPNRCAITTTGFSNQVTVHMPNKAWKMITASVKVLTRARSTFDQRITPTNNSNSPNRASADATTCMPRMYSGLAMATASDAPITCNQPCGRLRVASNASANTNTPNVPAIMRWNCSRQALLGSTGRIAVAA